MTTFRRLALASTVATFLLVAIGGLVRATKSGLGCGTDWPHCAGAVIPFFGNRAVVVEFSHRLMASVVVVLLAILAVVAWRYHRRDRRILWGSLAALGLVLFQAALGAIVVQLELQAEAVVLHLATALTLVAVLIFVTIAAGTTAGDAFVAPPDTSVVRRARLAAGAVLLVLLVGSWVSGRDAGYVFPDWPLMNGRLIPDLGFEPAAIHFLHRSLALLTGILVLGVALSVIRRKEELSPQAKLAHSALGLYVIQILIGAANVWVPPPSPLNELFVTMHLLIGALIWGSVVALAVVSAPGVQSRASEAAGAAALPAYEGGR